ncbi:hypothetical protein ACFL15_00465 [Patescibacteria group bacterium]
MEKGAEINISKELQIKTDELTFLHEQLPSEIYKGNIPLIKFGKKLEESKNSLVVFPGIGVPTFYDENGKLHYYHSEVIREVVKRSPNTSVVLLANWPGYEQKDNKLKNDLLAENERIPTSLDDKNNIMLEVIKYVSSTQPNITINAHSTSAGVIIRNLKDYQINKLVIDSPTGLGKKTVRTKLLDGLSQIGLLKHIHKAQQKNIEGYIKIISESFGLTEEEYQNDRYNKLSFLEIPPDVMQKETVSESQKFDGKIEKHSDLWIYIGGNDPMVNVNSIRDIISPETEVITIDKASHMFHRQEKYLDIWVEKVVEVVNST